MVSADQGQQGRGDPVLPGAGARAVPRAHALALVAVVAGGVTLLIRLALHGRSFDLFGDEVIYTDLGRSVASGGFPRFDGQLFFLHPPAFFYIEAGWQRLTGSQPGLVAQIYQMRTLNALFAGATAVVLVLLAARAVGSLRAGGAAALLFALDPFCIRQNDRALLETSMMLWVLLGYLVFISLIGRPQSRRSWARAVGAGLLFGLAVLTKDEATLLTVFPLLVAAALRWGPPRALTLLAAGTTTATYAAYVAVVAANGHIGAMWEAKTSGIQRILGLVQTTGFHHAGTPSIYALLFAESNYFGMTYVVLALAVPAVVLVHDRGGPVPRMLGLLWVVAAVTLGYAFFLGTIEEQELYLMIVPSLLILPVAATLMGGPRPGRRRSAAGRRPGMPQTAVVTAMLVVALSFNLAVCLQWLLQPDDGYAQLLQYMAAHVPAGATVTAFDGTAEDGITQYALGDRYRVGRWVTPAARSQEHVRYAVVPWTEILQHYSYYSPARVRSVVRKGQLLFSFRGRTYGDVTLYRLSLPPRTAGARRR
jgi:uncharacterized membrane protein